MFNVGSTEFLIILFVALLLFGAKRIPELARSVGKGVRDFRDAMSGIESEFRREVDLGSEPPRRPAPTLRPEPAAQPRGALAPPPPSAAVEPSPANEKTPAAPQPGSAAEDAGASTPRDSASRDPGLGGDHAAG